MSTIDPFKKTYNKSCEHCEGRGYNNVTEQLPPPGLMICSCCHGRGLLYKYSLDGNEHICRQCDGFRYQKDEVSQSWNHLYECCAKTGLVFDLANCRGVKLTLEETKFYGLLPVENPIINSEMPNET